MRTMKFRAWDVQDKFYLRNTVEPDDGNLCVKYIGNKHYEFTNWGDLVLQQWTGLRDINGTDIYEGDILDGIGPLKGSSKFEVVYEAPSFKRKWIDKHSLQRKRKPLEPLSFLDVAYEVIGNIYEGIKEETE
jgi:uncharacterized phage protein (TIGR01671 family)